MNLRQHKRRHARRLASRPPESIRFYRIRYSTPASVMVNVTVQWLTNPADR